MKSRLLPLSPVCRALDAGLLACSLLASVIAQGAQGYATTSQKAIGLTAVEAFGRWLEQRGGAGQAAFADPQELATGVRLAQDRAKEMRTLMEKDPEQFLRQA